MENEFGDNQRTVALIGGLRKRLDDQSAHRRTLAVLGTAEVPSVLYHYTTAAGLLGILEKQAFWATRADFLNDSSEIRYGLRLIEHTLTEYTGANSSEKLLCGRLLDDSRKYRRDVNTFVVCFCKRSDLLSQWNAYGGHGDGYAIGVRTPEAHVGAIKGGAELWPVEYNVGHQQEWIVDELRRTAGIMAEFVPACRSEDDRESLISETSRLFRHRAVEVACRFKDPLFEGEEEWRMVRHYHWNPQETDVEFRVRGGMVVPYISIPLRDTLRDRLPISEIIVGPTIDFRLARESLRLLISKKGHNAEIRSSAIPLRA